MQPHLVPIHALNTLEPEDFAVALRPLFEAADPLSQALYAKRPFTSYAQLLGRAEWLVRTLPQAQQLEVVNAHPRIGERGDHLSSLSLREQGNDREAALPTDEVERVYARLAELNRTYEEQFGFCFMVFVNGRSKAEIVEVLEDRLHNARADELQTALREMFLIAHDRLRLLTGHRRD